tara:strand:+ start:1728 stop:1925 length:198 start_codon:yes stop_codon:yes gene_type:complete
MEKKREVIHIDLNSIGDKMQVVSGMSSGTSKTDKSDKTSKGGRKGATGSGKVASPPKAAPIRRKP